jgi:hypothetical protein
MQGQRRQSAQTVGAPGQARAWKNEFPDELAGD